MSNTRAPGQKLISVPMNEKFIEQIDGALQQIGYSDRSSFIRDAIVEKLQAEGIEISAGLSLAPSRTGKGGRPPAASREDHKTAVVTPAKARKAKLEVKKKFRIPGGNPGAASFGRNYSA